MRTTLACFLATWTASLAVCAANASGRARVRARKAPSFKDVRGWSNLRWAMDVEKAKAALTKQSIKFKEEWMRGHFATPRPPGSGKTHRSSAATASGASTTCVTFHTLTFKIGPWSARAEFVGFGLRSVAFVRTGLSDTKAVAEEVKRLEKKYGRPVLRRAPSRRNGGTVARWSNKSTILDVQAYFWKGRWNFIKTYRTTGPSWR